jgi:hypothetical protein
MNPRWRTQSGVEPTLLCSVTGVLDHRQETHVPARAATLGEPATPRLHDAHSGEKGLSHFGEPLGPLLAERLEVVVEEHL